MHEALKITLSRKYADVVTNITADGRCRAVAVRPFVAVGSPQGITTFVADMKTAALMTLRQ